MKKKGSRNYEAKRKPALEMIPKLDKWRISGRAEGKDRCWLVADENEVRMKCSICIEVYGVQILVEGQVPENRHWFLHGSNNFRKSAVIDDENSTLHQCCHQA